MKQDTVYYWLTAMLFTLFFALFMITYQQRNVIAEDSIFIKIRNDWTECQVVLFADGVMVGAVSMDRGNCNIDLHED